MKCINKLSLIIYIHIAYVSYSFPTISHIWALIGNLNISVPLMRSQGFVKLKPWASVKAFYLLIIIYLSIPKAMQGGCSEGFTLGPSFNQQQTAPAGLCASPRQQTHLQYPCPPKHSNKKGKRINSFTSATDVNSRKCCLVRCLSSEPPQQRISPSSLLTALICNCLISCISHQLQISRQNGARFISVSPVPKIGTKKKTH